MLFNLLDKLFKLLISVKLAVIVILVLAALSAVGTIYESIYDAQYAQKIIYHSPLMYGFLGLLVTQLICVMVDRFPWRKRHIPFLLAHIGIIVTLIGSVITRYWGVDGSMSFGIGEDSKFVTVGDKEVTIYASFDGDKYTPVAQRAVDLLLQNPSDKPINFDLGQDKLQIIDFYNFAYRKESIDPSQSDRSNVAVRFQLENENVNLSKWLILERGKLIDEVNLGPAKVFLGEGEFNAPDSNSIRLKWNKDKNLMTYEVFTKRESKITAKGIIKEGDQIETGWMGLKLRILRLIPKAEKVVSYEKRDRPTPLTTSAVKVRYQDKEHWVGENQLLKLFSDTQVLVFNYGNRRLQLDFKIHLNKFNVGRYPGTMRAMSYESEVQVENGKKTIISMNEPLKHNGYTFYQASFQEDEMGNPIVSILSVNKDPGRFLKYLGSLLVVIGACWLFYKTSVQSFRKTQHK